MTMLLSRFDASTEFPTPERCHIIEIHRSEHDPACSVARARVAPGVTTQLHAMAGTAERYVLLEGHGRIEVGGDPPVELQPLDVVLIPAGTSQRITNTGSGDLVFLCICTPRFEPAAYVDLESGR